MTPESSHHQYVIDLVRGLHGGIGNYDKAIGELKSIDRRWLIGVLTGLLGDPDPEMRGNASTVLVKIDPKTALDLIVPLLNDSDASLRWHICGLLCDIGNEQVFPDLVRVLLADPEGHVRIVAAWALAKIGDSSVIPALQKAQQGDTGTDFEGRRVSDAAAEAISGILSRGK